MFILYVLYKAMVSFSFFSFLLLSSFLLFTFPASSLSPLSVPSYFLSFSGASGILVIFSNIKTLQIKSNRWILISLRKFCHKNSTGLLLSLFNSVCWQHNTPTPFTTSKLKEKIFMNLALSHCANQLWRKGF